MIIIPRKKTLDEGLEGLDAFFVMLQSGWINTQLFLYYCILFIVEVQARRATMNPMDAQEPFLLIVDGHGSRCNYLTLRFLELFNIDLLILPGHTSHILQPLDVGIFSPLKAEWKRMFDRSCIRIDATGHIIQAANYTAKELRYLMITAFLDAIAFACTPTNIKSAFQATGLHPVDPFRPLFRCVLSCKGRTLSVASG
ncbi:transposase, putative [Trichomonas vaginalis G3]|uniref:Transposase, putative n=1 Tax=Trichomonas vaginalis (strain ATCC PRA-98 / G3) TaxID=412133 RepID=A2GJA6_TRIV3|nr:DDE endonuclease family [Trichomonas vaginalis G3]EAX82760.1 transposase, putative [Trichomonas vaginalis G3]KAI5545513.1 DDE endonuclease family [Trichomonas vaginalis G3]|eukprot:XP_001295690.1 transposase [Trichomonas vaginalis G3]